VKRATIGEVAAHAGVSTATVSRVVNGGVVAEGTATRVLAAISDLGYSPNALTRGVFAGRATTIGAVIRDLSSPFYVDLVRGVDDVAAEHHSLVLLASTFRQVDREIAQVRAMDEQRVRGLVVTTGDTSDDHTRGMAANGTPCVIVARTVPDPPPRLHSVSLDNVAAGRLMAAHLAGCGRSSVGVVTSGGLASQTARVAGLRQFFDVPVASAANEADVPDAVDALLTAARDRGRPLDAVVCTSGRLTVAVHTALTARGTTIPDDVAFLTVDDFPWAATHGITVITQPAYRMGRQAAELVVANPDEPAEVVVEPTLLARTSCGEPRR
jgi:LacI family transcriptional regulator